MSKITFLGTASAIPDKNHHNSHFVFQSQDHVILFDCSENPFVRMDEAGLDPNAITDLILTHFHPDHVSGLPSFLMDLWLDGRKKPLNILGLDEVIEQIEQLMTLYHWQHWDGMFPVRYSRHSGKGAAETFLLDAIRIDAVPISHLIPGIGVRVTFPEASFCYSSDTAPCEAIVRLAKGTDLLIHEASGAYNGHSTAQQAGKVAEEATVPVLYLIHYPPDSDPLKMIMEAKSCFSGNVVVAEDLMTIIF